MTDEALLALIHQPGSHEDGFRQLVIKYQHRLYQVIRHRLPSHADTDDVLQNTFIKIFRHIGNFERRSELYTWMYRIACNEVINYQKAGVRSKYTEIDPQMKSEAEAFMDSNSITVSLDEAVNQLPARQQMVFRMRYFDELSYREMSEILDVTEGALKASFHHAVKKLKKHFGPNKYYNPMNEKKEIQDEIRSIANGLPVPPDDAPPPEYFDQLPDAILNRWKNEVSIPKTKTIAWKKVIAIAAILTGVCIGLFISNPKDQTPLPITSAEAFAYISENIDEFEGMIEVGNQESQDASWDVSPDAIHEYLMEESSEELIEDLY